jgi:hypothetical protein
VRLRVGVTGLGVAWIIAVAGGCATVSTGPAKGGRVWRELTSDHFVLRSDLSQLEAMAVLRTLEDTRATMIGTMWSERGMSHQRLAAIAMASADEMVPYMGTSFSALHVHSRPFPPTLFISDLEDGSDAKHELAHYLSRQVWPIQPAWFSEGIASFFESVHADPNADHGMIVGEPVSHRLKSFQMRGATPLDQLLASVPTESAAQFQFYATSWLLVHDLINRRPQQLDAFQELVGELVPGPVAFRRTFPDLATGKLAGELDDYSRRGQYRARLIEIPRWNERAGVRELSPAEVHALRAFLRAVIPTGGEAPEVRRAAIQADLAQALRATSPPIEALALAFFYMDTSRQADAAAIRAELARRAIATNPNQWMAWLMAHQSAPPGSDERSRALQKALALAPEEPEVWTALADERARAGRWPEVLKITNRFLGAGATNHKLWILHLEAMVRTGRCAPARLWGRALENYLAPDERGLAEAVGWHACGAPNGAGTSAAGP